MPDAALTTFLDNNNLSHLATLFADSSLSSLEAKLDEGRAGFLTYCKTAGVTALKDRQGLTNAIGKAKRERQSGGATTTAAPATPA